MVIAKQTDEPVEVPEQSDCSVSTKIVYKFINKMRKIV